ncbi:MAG: radical SAM protein [Syntrophorhabdaceae bacterium]|nr:radical SAM protein [Syntrophorhabdaceae bacterium]
MQRLEPFEICSIRPPTENYSLTFRLTRNCAWNRCLFCPVYKFGAKFSRRAIDEVKADINRAKAIDDLLMENVISGISSVQEGYREIQRFIKDTGDTEATVPEENSVYPDYEDPRIQWFSRWFKDTPNIEDSIEHIYTWRMGGGQTCFLGDANTLLVDPYFFVEIAGYIRECFPTINRLTIYGRTKSAAKVSVDELRVFKEAGLNRIHFGIESGSDRVLTFMKKGITAQEHIEGCLKTKEAGISPSVYIMPGLGGVMWSKEHAYETARVLTEARPDYVRIRTLEIFPQTGLMKALEAGEFTEAEEEDVVKEIKIIIENTDTHTTIVSDSASNLLDVNGRLPEDKKKMLSVIDSYLSLTPREKLEFSLSSRLQSFVGQYGGITHDIYSSLASYIHGGQINLSAMSDEIIKETTRLIRSKLMP